MAVNPFAFMAVDAFPLIVVLLLGLLLIGGIVAVVVLLANPRTRAAGAALLAIGLVVVVVGGFLLLGLSLTLPAVSRSRELARREMAQVEATRRAQDGEMARQRAEMMKAEAQTAEEFRRNFADQMQPAPQVPAEQPAPPAATGEAPPVADPKTEAPPEAAAPPAEPAAAPSGDTDASSKAKEAASKQAEPAAAEKRPAWVDSLTQSTGNVYQMAIKTDPRLTQQECESELPAVVRDAVRQYAETELDRSPEIAQQVQLPLPYVQDHIVKEKWLEPVHVSLPGKWVRLHVLLEFDQEAKQQVQKECEQAQGRLDQQWQEASVLRRLWCSGAGLAAVLALLSLLFACLKIDQATDGAWRGRLFLAGGVATLVVAGAACLGVYRLRAVGTEVGSPAVPQIEPAAYGVFDPGSPQPTAAVIFHPARLTVLSIGLLLLATLAVVLSVSRKARPIGLALLALVLLGGLAVVLAAAGSHMPVGPVELLVLAVIVVLPVCVLYAVVAFAWRARRRRIEVETSTRARADVGVGQP
jgi:hypothetical protein